MNMDVGIWLLVFGCWYLVVGNIVATYQQSTTKNQKPITDNQTTRQPNNNQCLEDITEQSESNPGQSLGITTDEQGNCLEDSTYTV